MAFSLGMLVEESEVEWKRRKVLMKTGFESLVEVQVNWLLGVIFSFFFMYVLRLLYALTGISTLVCFCFKLFAWLLYM